MCIRLFCTKTHTHTINKSRLNAMRPSWNWAVQCDRSTFYSFWILRQVYFLFSLSYRRMANEISYHVNVLIALLQMCNCVPATIIVTYQIEININFFSHQTQQMVCNINGNTYDFRRKRIEQFQQRPMNGTITISILIIQGLLDGIVKGVQKIHENR